MRNIIRDIKELSVSGVLAIFLSDRKIRLISSSNIVASLQRVQHELLGSERIKILHSPIPNKKLRSLITYTHKKRLERLGYKVNCGIKRWGLDCQVEDYNNSLIWVVRAKNTYSEIIIGLFEDKEEMDIFLKQYYIGNRISTVVISSNKKTREYYLEQKE